MTDSRSCPICKRRLPEGEEGARFRPFCSKRCADVDLGRWLTGSYAIPAAPSDDESENAAETPAEPGDEGRQEPISRH